MLCKYLNDIWTAKMGIVKCARFEVAKGILVRNRRPYYNPAAPEQSAKQVTVTPLRRIKHQIGRIPRQWSPGRCG